MLTKFSYLLLFILCLTGVSSHLRASQETKIKTIVFDFGGVIAKSDREEIAQFIAKSLNISLNEAFEALALLKSYSVQNKNEPNFWLTYAHSHGITLPNNWQEQLNDVRFHATQAVPGMIELVKELQKQGFQTALLSNVRESQAQIKRKLGYYELFQPAIFSYEIGVSKPDPKAYQMLLEQLKRPPQEVLFIDNKSVNIEAAKSLCLDAIQFVNTSQLIEELKKRGIEVSISLQDTPAIKR